MTDPTPDTTTGSFLDDFVDIWVSPKAVFARRMDGKWGLAMLVLVVLSGVLFFGTSGATEPLIHAETARSMAAQGQASPEQLEAARNMQPIMMGAFIFIGTPIMLFLLGFGVWLATKIVGGTLSYVQGLTIACFAAFPRLLEAITTAGQAMMMEESALTGRNAVSFGPARFMNPDTADPALLALLVRVDLFTLWITVLIAVGIAVIAKRSWDQAITAGALVWVLGALPTVIPALLRG